ncbi:hypothetical protein F0L74_22945 [Chitinophaga agrisoli]|uniref:Uncharacterized protein n=1 Tax=Chitinophaga agrisoli TaxID=2607653 RepID=A0A5B2VL94_9BACT|nr:hypothetical protein [Chitinophaga agrisoli]KAA2239072.1 hypothetical protein F0L74_22945 [Chitinophaga agrisoli]
MKKLSVAQMLVLAVIALAAGCKKDDDPGREPGKPTFLPVSVSYTVEQNGSKQRVILDSLVYNGDYSVGTLFMDGLDNQQWEYRIQFGYNSNKQCTTVTWFNGDNNNIRELDSLAYTGNKVTIYRLDPDDHRVWNSSSMTLGSDNKVALLGSKDTLIEMDTKMLDYTEFTYNSDGNPANFFIIIMRPILAG